MSLNTIILLKTSTTITLILYLNTKFVIKQSRKQITRAATWQTILCNGTSSIEFDWFFETHDVLELLRILGYPRSSLTDTIVYAHLYALWSLHQHTGCFYAYIQCFYMSLHSIRDLASCLILMSFAHVRLDLPMYRAHIVTVSSRSLATIMTSPGIFRPTGCCLL